MKTLLSSLFFLFSIFTYGQFFNEIQLSSTVAEHESLSADLNGDGVMDFVFHNEWGIQWTTPTSDVQIIHEVYRIPEEDVESYMITIATEDIDMDGDIDIAFGTQGMDGPGVAWMENIGDGEFAAHQVIVEDVSLRRIYFKDIDNDGDPDIVVNTINSGVIYPYALLVVENDGTGSFSTPVLIDSHPLQERSSNFGDLDNDGDLDLVLAVNNDDEIFWYENLGSMTFGTGNLITSDCDKVQELFPIDMDDDGDLDVAFISFHDDKVSWQENLGGGTFGDQHLIYSLNQPTLMMFEDVDGDTDLDLIVAWREDVPFTVETHISFFENIAPGEYEDPVLLIESIDQMASFSYGDMNDDGVNDLLFRGTNYGEYSFLPNLGGASFGDPVRIAGNIRYPSDVESSDLDNDGDQEIVVMSEAFNRIAYYNNIGDNQFAPLAIISEESFSLKGLILFDVNNDTYIDIITATNEVGAGLIWYQNMGDGTFSDYNVIAGSDGASTKLTLMDVDGDGDDDLIRALFGAEINLIWYENTGTGFGPETEIPNSIGTILDIEISDFDGDDDQDLIISGYTSGSFIYWIENLDGIFASELELTSVSETQDIAVADVNGDDLTDVIVVNNLLSSSEVLWYENMGDVALGEPIVISSGTFPISRIEMKDLNLDGRIDVLGGGGEIFGPFDSAPNLLFWLENMGEALFSEPSIISSKVENVKDIFVTDIDADGDQDILTASHDNGRIDLFESMLTTSQQVKGNLYFDENENGERDLGETGLDLIQMGTEPMEDFAYTFPNGDYVLNLMNVEDGDYIILPEELDHWMITSDPVEYTVTVDDAFEGAVDYDFGFFPSDDISELNLSLTGGFPRCNSQADIWVNFSNIGGTIANGVVSVQLDEEITYIESIIPTDSIVDGIIYWSYEDLFYFERRYNSING